MLLDKCETCVFFDEHRRADGETMGGNCRRYPPVVVAFPMADGSGRTEFEMHLPYVGTKDGCGEHKENSWG